MGNMTPWAAGMMRWRWVGMCRGNSSKSWGQRLSIFVFLKSGWYAKEVWEPLSKSSKYGITLLCWDGGRDTIRLSLARPTTQSRRHPHAPAHFPLSSCCPILSTKESSRTPENPEKLFQCCCWSHLIFFQCLVSKGSRNAIQGRSAGCSPKDNPLWLWGDHRLTQICQVQS